MGRIEYPGPITFDRQQHHVMGSLGAPQPQERRQPESGQLGRCDPETPGDQTKSFSQPFEIRETVASARRQTPAIRIKPRSDRRKRRLGYTRDALFGKQISERGHPTAVVSALAKNTDRGLVHYETLSPDRKFDRQNQKGQGCKAPAPEAKPGLLPFRRPLPASLGGSPTRRPTHSRQRT